MRKLVSVFLIIALLGGLAVAANAHAQEYVTYAQFGAVGDGVTCDFDAIIAAHEYANEHDLPVRVDSGTYFIGASSETAIIQTNTDWTGASFIIDNSNLPENYKGPKIFADFNRAFTNEAYVEKYPYMITEEVNIKNMTIKSGKPYLVSNNQFMFQNVRIEER